MQDNTQSDSAKEQVTDALRKSERRYRSLFENSIDGILLLRRDDSIIDANPRACSILGYTHEELVNMTIPDLHPPSEHKRMMQLKETITRTGSFREVEDTHYITKDGRIIPVSLTVKIIRSVSDPIAFVHFRDITERKLAERAVKESERRFRSLVDNIPGTVYRCEIVHPCHMRHISESVFDITGYPASDFMEDNVRDFGDLIVAEDVERIERGVAEAAASGGAFELEYRIRHADGHVRWLHEKGIPVYDDKGNAVWLDGVILDITERKAAEEALKFKFELEELLTSVSTEFINLKSDEIDGAINEALATIADAVCVDRGYIFLYSANRRRMSNVNEFCRHGIPPQQDRLQDLPAEAFPWFDANMSKFEVVAVDSVADLAKEAQPEKEEWQKQGILSLLCVPMVCRDRLIGFVGFDTVLYETQWTEEVVAFLKILGTVFANAIDRKRSEQERERLLNTLAVKNEELQSIVYVASHDLKTPLVNIQGFSGELAKACRAIKTILEGYDAAELKEQLAPFLDEDVPEALRFIRAGGVKMQSLLDGLLAVSRVGSDALEIETLNMNDTIKGVVASMQFQISNSGAELTVGDLPFCRGDNDHINQVFSNLIANAVKYLDPSRKGKITVTGSLVADESIYCVEDNGVGIDPEHRQKIFEIFHRLENRNDVKGEGLGLTIALRILERHQGRIWLESEPGNGSKFFVALPTA